MPVWKLPYRKDSHFNHASLSVGGPMARVKLNFRWQGLLRTLVVVFPRGCRR